jgi:uncharacterized protein (TIGR03085 family)
VRQDVVMTASRHARRERQELAELMLDLGPDAPTLCEGWTTRDLAAHLVVREGRPDAAVGIVVRPAAGWTARVQRAATAQPYPELVRRVRTGPPTVSFFAIPGVDSLANLLEYVVHHEDVIRAQPDWVARTLPDDLSDELWRRLGRMAKLMFRSSPVGVTLERTDGTGGTIVARAGQPMVTLRGTPLELVLRSYGRRAVQIEVLGDPDAVAAFEGASFGV